MKLIIEIIKELVMLTVLTIISTLLLLFFFYLISFTINNCYEGSKTFEYEDLDGNKGIANNCQYSDAERYGRKGGQGQPICFVDNKVVSVKWYEDKTEYIKCNKVFKEELGWK